MQVYGHRVDKTKYLDVRYVRLTMELLHIPELNMKLHNLYTFYNMVKHFLNILWLKNACYT